MLLRRSIPRSGWVVLGIALAIWFLPYIGSQYQMRYGILILQSVGLALSWNIISGYAGYLSLGHVVFFGIGAYAGALLLADAGAPWPLALTAGGIVSGLVALPLGWILLRLRGAYFAIAMLASWQAFRLLAGTWESLTRGGRGIYLPPEYNLPYVYWTMLLVAGALLLYTLSIDQSRFGLQLISIKEDEEAAEALGVPTVAAKVKAFVISAVAPGIIGAAYAWSVSYIDPTSTFRPETNLNMVVMTMLGGAGTVFGPVIGAVFLGIVFEQLWARFPDLYLAAFGAIVVVVAMFMPQGVLPLINRLRGAPKRRSYLVASVPAPVASEKVSDARS